jgi:hypothetical protein
MLPLVRYEQVEQLYFPQMEFAPTSIACLAEPELVAEKLRAGYQRRKARDVYDLAYFARRPRNEALVKKLLLLKLWNVFDRFDYARFDGQFADKKAYDWDDLYQLIPRADHEAPDTFLARVRDAFSFMKELSEAEQAVSLDSAQRRVEEAQQLLAECLVVLDSRCLCRQ